MGDHRSRTVVRLVAESRFRGTSARQTYFRPEHKSTSTPEWRCWDVTFVAVVFFVARHMVPIGVQTRTVPRAHGTQQVSRNQTGGLPSGVWDLLDELDAEDLFLRQIPMLRSCPRFLR